MALSALKKKNQCVSYSEYLELLCSQEQILNTVQNMSSFV